MAKVASKIIAVGVSSDLTQIIKPCVGVDVTFVDDMQALKMRGGSAPEVVLIYLQAAGAEAWMPLLPQARDIWPSVRIIAITDSTLPEVLDQAFSYGVDDFIKTPLDVAELALRIGIRRATGEEKIAIENIQFGDVTIDTQFKIIRGPKGKRVISPIEAKVLNYLAKADGSLIEKNTLKAKCWGQLGVTDNALHRKLHEIRGLLKHVSDQVMIKSKYGTGFYLKYETHYKLAS